MEALAQIEREATMQHIEIISLARGCADRDTCHPHRPGEINQPAEVVVFAGSSHLDSFCCLPTARRRGSARDNCFA